MKANSALLPGDRLRLELQAAKQLDNAFRITMRKVVSAKRIGDLAPIWEVMKRDLTPVLEALFRETFLAAATRNGSNGFDALTAADVFAKRETAAIIGGIVNFTRTQVTKGLAVREALFGDLKKLLAKVFGKVRIQRIITTSTTRAESGGIEFVASTLNTGQGVLGGVALQSPNLSVGNLLRTALARDTPTVPGELIEPTTVEGFENRQFKLVWRLNPNCKHCLFCPLIAGTDSLFYKRFIQAPPAHTNCCCNVEIVGADFKEKPRPSVITVLGAARLIGLI